MRMVKSSGRGVVLPVVPGPKSESPFLASVSRVFLPAKVPRHQGPRLLSEEAVTAEGD